MLQVDREKNMRFQPYTKNYTLMSNDGGRSDYPPQGRIYQFRVLCCMVIPGSIYGGNIIQTKVIFRNVCVWHEVEEKHGRIRGYLEGGNRRQNVVYILISKIKTTKIKCDTIKIFLNLNFN